MDGCNGCGSCCDPVYLPPGARMKIIKKNDPYHIENGNLEWARNLIPRGDGYYDCPKFDKVSRNCGDYENRPLVCSDYPFYNKPPDLLSFDHCVYWKEVPVGISGVHAV